MVAYHKNRADNAERNEKKALDELAKSNKLLETKIRLYDNLEDRFTKMESRLNKIEASRARSQQIYQERQSQHAFWSSAQGAASSKEMPGANSDQYTQPSSEAVPFNP